MSGQNAEFKLCETLHAVALIEIFETDVGIRGPDETCKEQKNLGVVGFDVDEKMTLKRDNGVFGQSNVIMKFVENQLEKHVVLKLKNGDHAFAITIHVKTIAEETRLDAKNIDTRDKSQVNYFKGDGHVEGILISCAQHADLYAANGAIGEFYADEFWTFFLLL